MVPINYLKSTIDYIKYLVTEMEADQPIKVEPSRTIVFTQANKLASSSRHCNSWDIAEREKRTPTEIFDTQNREIFSATSHFEKEKKNICLASYTVKTKSKGKKNVVVLSTSRPLHDKTIDDGKENPQIIKFYDFTKGGTDIVDLLNDYYTTR